MVNLYSKQLKTFREAGFRNVGWLSPAEIDTLINLYDADIRYVDDNIGRLLESLGNHLENTIIIVTADHGEAFGEHNSLGHGTLYEELIRVPLIIAGPGIKAGAVVSEPVELMDLAPTIADSVGIARVKGFHGRSLLTVVRDGQRVARGTINVRHQFYLMRRLISYRTHDLKYIRTERLDEVNTVLSEEVYDLRNDPQERRNLHGSAETRTFELEAVNRILQFKQLKSEQKTANEKERIRARLKKIPKL